MKHYHKNPRKITRKQMDDLKRWLVEFGDLSGIVHNLPTDEIIGGNQRSEALAGVMSGLIQPVITERFDPPQEDGTVCLGYYDIEGRRYQYRGVQWDDAKAERANLIANKAGGVWDFDILANEFEIPVLLESGFSEAELIGEGFDFGEESRDAEPQVDRAAELLEKWQVKTGDLWQIGEHRLLCGDSTKREDVARVMGGERADVTITSPPYFNQREYSQWESYEDYLSFVSKIVNNLPLGDDCILGVNIGSDEPARRWMPSDWWGIMRDADYLYRECIAWVKAAAVWSVPRSMHINKGHYFPALRWEIILVGSKGKHPKFEMDDVSRVREFDENVWNIGVVTGGEQKALGHNAPFPVEIPERFIMAYTTKDKVVYEPFIGSGTTLVACQNLGRKGRGIEISPAYCSVTLQRMEDAFGITGVKIE